MELADSSTHFIFGTQPKASVVVKRNLKEALSSWWETVALFSDYQILLIIIVV